jgi:hypothetical protein
MVATDDNPYRSPSHPGSKVKSQPLSRVLVVFHALATLNWGFTVAWMYSEAMKPGYPLVDTSPPGLSLYVTVSFSAALLFFPVPVVLTIFLIPRAKDRSISLGELGIWILAIALSGLTIWLIQFTMSPPIHAI